MRNRKASSLPKSVVNFNCPTELLKQFDHLSELSNRTRTAAIIELMESYVVTQAETLNKKKTAYRAILELD